MLYISWGVFALQLLSAQNNHIFRKGWGFKNKVNDLPDMSANASININDSWTMVCFIYLHTLYPFEWVTHLKESLSDIHTYIYYMHNWMSSEELNYSQGLRYILVDIPDDYVKKDFWVCTWKKWKFIAQLLHTVCRVSLIRHFYFILFCHTHTWVNQCRKRAVGVCKMRSTPGQSTGTCLYGYIIGLAMAMDEVILIRLRKLPDDHIAN